MSQEDQRDDHKKVPFEREALIIEGRFERLERQQEESKKRDEDHKKRQIQLDEKLVRVTRWLVICAVVTNALYFYLALAAKRSADAATAAVGVAEKTLESGNESFNKTRIEMQAQSKAMQDSANAAIESNRITLLASRDEQRPWVGPSESVKPTPQQLEKGGTDFIFAMKIDNRGKTPALHIKNETGLRFLDPGAKFEPTYISRENAPESLTVLFPNSWGVVHSSPMPLNQQQVAVLKQGKKILYLFGRIEYMDTARRIHHTTFCYWLRPELDVFSACDTYNSAD